MSDEFAASDESPPKLTAVTNVIKTREDYQLVLFEEVGCEEGTPGPCFEMRGNSTCSWLRPNEKTI